MAYFGVAQVLLHVAMGAFAWLLACASVTIWPANRAKFGRIIVGWFCGLAAATLAYNALWYPRTFFGAHHYDLMVVEAGPFHVGQWIYGSALIAAAAILLAGGCLRLEAYALGSSSTLGHRRRCIAALAVASMLVIILISRLERILQPESRTSSSWVLIHCGWTN